MEEESSHTMSMPDPSRMEDISNQLRKRARVLQSLARSIKEESPRAVEKALGQLAALPRQSDEPQLQAAGNWLRQERATRRQRLSADLRRLCAESGVEILVLSKDPLELRLVPLSVSLDLARNRAELAFANQILLRCEAQAPAIMEARLAALQTLEGRDWNPGAYLELLLETWMTLRKQKGEDWVELVEILPALVMALQTKRFKRDPSARNFTPYPRVRFAWDLWRLRRDRALATGSWRLSLGPATGGTTRNKSRVLWLEDSRGQGQYHLTMRFIKENRT